MADRTPCPLSSITATRNCSHFRLFNAQPSQPLRELDYECFYLVFEFEFIVGPNAIRSNQSWENRRHHFARMRCPFPSPAFLIFTTTTLSRGSAVKQHKVVKIRGEMTIDAIKLQGFNFPARLLWYATCPFVYARLTSIPRSLLRSIRRYRRKLFT